MLTAVGDDLDPDTALAAVVALRRQADQLERKAVELALASGWTWSAIGQALGISGQAAHKRLGPGRRETGNAKRRGTR
jgi:DNA-directed RNA polymerase specialized sigma24 family protein